MRNEPLTLNCWVRTFMDWTSDLESPDLFLAWSGYCLLSAAVGRHVFMPWGFQRIFPNLYVILIGPSGTGKGTAMKPTITLADYAGIPNAPQKITPEDLYRFLAENEQTYSCPVRGDSRQNLLLCTAEELLVFMRTGPNNTEFIASLCDLYDCSPAGWRNFTKNRGRDVLKGAAFILLGGSSPQHLKTIFSGDIAQGGFTSRTIFVVEGRPRKDEPFPHDPDPRTKDKLLLGLEAARRRVGLIALSEAARSYYAEWYQGERKKQAEGIWPVGEPHFRDYCNWRPLHLRKVAILNAIAEGEREVGVGSLESARQLLERTEERMGTAFGGKGLAPLSELTFIVREFIRSSGGKTTRGAVLRAFPTDLDAESLRRIEDTLANAGVIQVSSAGGKVSYQSL